MKLALIIFITLVIISFANSQQVIAPIDCTRMLPGLREICHQFRQFGVITSRNLFGVSPQFVNTLSRNQQFASMSSRQRQNSFASTVYDCMDLQCLCPYFGGNISSDRTCRLRNGQLLQRAVRKEIRTLSDDERRRFFNAIRQLKASGEYGRLAILHRQEATNSGAHSGPSFLLWHREFMKRMEIALRLIDPSLALPYWDSTLDHHLIDPRDSIMWSPTLMGETNLNGQVINGPFVGFSTLEGHPTITRILGREGHLFTDQNIAAVYAKNTIDGILAYTAPTKACPYPPNFSALEYYHASVHLWVGGDMKPPVTAANDPVFYLHHSFVDYIFEQWRQMHQNRIQRERDYPMEIRTCTTPLHFANAIMRPFNLVNQQGLSNAYTDHLYTYAPRPTCSQQQRSCGSQFLFCDLQNGPAHCVSKIKLGGRCDRFNGEDACFMGICWEGYCRQGIFTTTTSTLAPQSISRNEQPLRITNTQTHRFFSRPETIQQSRNASTLRPRIRNDAEGNIDRTSALMRAATTSLCLNDDPCCSIWSVHSGCSRNVEYMRKSCRRSCGYCRNLDGNRNDCFDRYKSCSFLRSQGECNRKRQWMAENCRFSCGWCNIPISQLCSRMTFLDRTPKIVK